MTVIALIVVAAFVFGSSSHKTTCNGETANVPWFEVLLFLAILAGVIAKHTKPSDDDF